MDANAFQHGGTGASRQYLRVSVNSVVTSRRSAFTLIELLVVVAIISILAAMLLPALEGAKWKGRAIRCVNNVRQLMIPLHLYTQDYDGYLPVANPMNIPANGWDYGGWIPQLAKYANVPTNSPGTSFNVSSSSVFYCPVLTKGSWAVNDNFHWSYAMNHDLRQRYGFDADGTHPMKIDEFRDHGRTMAFTENGSQGDVLHYHFFDYGLWGYPSLPVPPQSGPAHGGRGLPFAYLDGHAEFFARVPDWTEYHNNIWSPGPQWPWAHKSFWGNAPADTAWGSTYAVLIAPYE